MTRQSPPDQISDQTPHADARSGRPTYYALGKVAGDHKLDLPDKFPRNSLPRKPVMPSAADLGPKSPPAHGVGCPFGDSGSVAAA